MKKLFFLTLVVMSVCSLCAAQYCGTELTGSNLGHKAYISCQSLGGDQYELRFVSEDPIVSYNAVGSNLYANVNGAGGYHVSEHFEQTGNVLVCVMTSNVVPSLYVADFFVMYADGEEFYKIPIDADFSLSCGDVTPGDGTETGGEDPGEENPAGGLTPGKCEGYSKAVDSYYSDANDKAVTVMQKGFHWVAETTASGVKVSVQFLDNMPGMAAPQLFRFNAENVLIDSPIPMQWDPATLTASYLWGGVADGDRLTFLVQVALEAGGILFSSRVTYTVGSSCSAEDNPDQGESALMDTEAQKEVKKMLENGQILIIRNGVRYTTIGQRLN